MELTNMGAAFTVDGAPWVTEKVFIIEGTKTLSGSSSPGMVTLVSPIRIDASSTLESRVLAGAAFMKLTYVPEPGTVMMLGAGVASLLIFGRGRMQD